MRAPFSTTDPYHLPSTLIMAEIDNARAHFQVLATAPSKQRVQRPTSYATLLEAPLSTIAGNVPDRADVMSNAILGYN